MNKLFAVLATSTLILPAVASAGALEDARDRGICGEDVTPLAAEYVDVDGVNTLKVLCPAAGILGGAPGGALGGTTLTPAAAAGIGIGALGLGIIVSDDDESGTTTTTTASGS